jgi:hypothetical protein
MMQVEVTKYTDGTKENAISSNGMLESFIKYHSNFSGQNSHFVKKHVFDTLFNIEFFEICCE